MSSRNRRRQSRPSPANPRPSQRRRSSGARSQSSGANGPLEKLVLSYLMTKGFISEDNLNQFIANIDTQAHNIEGLVRKINSNISFLDFEIRKRAHETDGVIYWTLVNNRNDDTAQLASSMTPKQLNYFKKVMDKIVSNKGRLALHHAGAKRFNLETGKEMDRMIPIALDEGWLEKRNGFYFLGVRTYEDLRTYLKEINPANCNLCSKICIFGLRCSEEAEVQGCEARVHHGCADKWFQSRERKCPKCKAKWGNSNGSHSLDSEDEKKDNGKETDEEFDE